MADQDDTSKTRSNRNEAEPAAPAAPASPPAPVGGAHAPLATTMRSQLEETIEAERLKLLQANSALKCLHDVLLHAEGEDAVTCAQATQVVIELIDESVERLDCVHLKPLIRDLKLSARFAPEEESLKFGFDDDSGVREPRAAYRWR